MILFLLLEIRINPTFLVFGSLHQEYLKMQGGGGKRGNPRSWIYSQRMNLPRLVGVSTALKGQVANHTSGILV